MTRRPPSTRSPAWPPRSTARSRSSGTDALSERPERRRRWGASHRRRFHLHPTRGSYGHNCPSSGQAGAMAKRRTAGGLRRLRPWLIGWAAFQVAVAVTGWLLAWRRNEGDATSTSIRRTLTHGGLELRPTNPRVTRVRVDLAMAGAAIDLTGLPRPESGIDVTARVLMGGLAVRVPADWRVWWQMQGVGGMGGDGAVQRERDEQGADVRVHAAVVLGGVGIEAV